MFNKIKKVFIYALVSAFTMVSFTQPARAAMIGTDQVLSAQTVQQNQQKIAATLDRPEVVAQLEKFGVSKEQAQERVTALTDAEAAALADRIDTLPAGAGILETVGLVVLILIITDFLGLTRIFPFTRS